MDSTHAKILILGSTGLLGGEFRKIFPQALAWNSRELDVTDFSRLREKIVGALPDVVVNCVAYNNVDAAESNREIAGTLNAQVPLHLAKICTSINATLVHFSTNYVFDGIQGEYKEQDPPHPLSVYAQSKYNGELAIREHSRAYYLVRTAVLFGGKGQSQRSKPSFVDLMVQLGKDSNRLTVVTDEINSVTFAKDLVAAVAGLFANNAPFGIYHIVNSGSASWYDIAKEIFSIHGNRINLVPVSAAEYPRPARRPHKAVLLNTKLLPLRPWQAALREYLVSSL